MNEAFGMNTYTLPYIKQIINKDPCVAQGMLLSIL